MSRLEETFHDLALDSLIKDKEEHKRLVAQKVAEHRLLMAQREAERKQDALLRHNSHILP